MSLPCQSQFLQNSLLPPIPHSLLSESSYYHGMATQHDPATLQYLHKEDEFVIIGVCSPQTLYEWLKAFRAHVPI